MPKIVDRTIDFFELFADQKRPLPLSEISRLMGISPSSCHDILKALEARGYVYEVARRGGFYPTRRLQGLGNTISAHDPVLLRAEISLRSLRDLIDESVHLLKVSGLQATYLSTFDSSHPLRMMVSVGNSLRSVYATSAGKALLANLDEEALNAYLRTVVLAPLTPATVTSKAELRAQIDEGRRNGYFVNREETVEGVMTVTAPFRWNRAVYLVTVAGMTSRMEAKIASMGPVLLGLCRRLEMADTSD